MEPSVDSRIRVLVVDDSPFMRTVIGDLLRDGGLQVVGEAADGREAVSLVAEQRPDVVTMDIEMEGMNGIEAVERIMADTPTPIVMLSAYAEENADVTFEALERGAVDFLAKPGGEISAGMASLEMDLVDTVRSVATVDVTDLDTVEAGRPLESQSAPITTPALDGPTTVVIGSSTGGPGVVESLLRCLPPMADLRVLIVQHMPGPFTGRFAERLHGACGFTVHEARDGLRIGPGEAVVARGESHMCVDAYANGRLRIGLNSDPRRHGVRPAVDVTMESAAKRIDDPLLGVILTGMGSDGAAGIQAIKRAGGRTIAQDETTSTVFGMPKRAIETGAVDVVVPQAELASAILAESSEAIVQ